MSQHSRSKSPSCHDEEEEEGNQQEANQEQSKVFEQIRREVEEELERAEQVLNAADDIMSGGKHSEHPSRNMSMHMSNREPSFPESFSRQISPSRAASRAGSPGPPSVHNASGSHRSKAASSVHDPVDLDASMPKSFHEPYGDDVRQPLPENYGSRVASRQSQSPSRPASAMAEIRAASRSYASQPLELSHHSHASRLGVSGIPEDPEDLLNTSEHLSHLNSTQPMEPLSPRQMASQLQSATSARYATSQMQPSHLNSSQPMEPICPRETGSQPMEPLSPRQMASQLQSATSARYATSQMQHQAPSQFDPSSEEPPVPGIVEFISPSYSKKSEVGSYGRTDSYLDRTSAPADYSTSVFSQERSICREEESGVALKSSIYNASHETGMTSYIGIPNLNGSRLGQVQSSGQPGELNMPDGRMMNNASSTEYCSLANCPDVMLTAQNCNPSRPFQAAGKCCGSKPARALPAEKERPVYYGAKYCNDDDDDDNNQRQSSCKIDLDFSEACSPLKPVLKKKWPKKPELTRAEINNLIQSEAEDIKNALLISAGERKAYKKPCPKQQKAQMMVKSMVDSQSKKPDICGKEYGPLEEPDPEDISPEVAAAMMYAQEQGIKLAECPDQTIKHLFPDDSQAMDKNVSVVDSKVNDEELIEKSASVPSEGVSDSAYTRRMSRRSGEGLSNRESLDVDMAFDQEKREYVLLKKKPVRINKIQFRGNEPQWFPGYFSAFPDQEPVFKIDSLPQLFMRAWTLVNPSSVPASDIVVIGE